MILRMIDRCNDDLLRMILRKGWFTLREPERLQPKRRDTTESLHPERILQHKISDVFTVALQAAGAKTGPSSVCEKGYRGSGKWLGDAARRENTVLGNQ